MITNLFSENLWFTAVFVFLLSFLKKLTFFLIKINIHLTYK